jgi:exopolysaccharide biosynthesis WecB/TagA/CpsF family protein
MIRRGRHSVLGVLVDAIDYEAATEEILDAARERRPLAVTALAVHGVMTGAQDREHEARLNSFDLVVPDGQPVRWALNLIHHAGLRDRVYGPELTMRVLRRCASEATPVYFYGSTEETLTRLLRALERELPELRVAGSEPSGFGTADPGEANRIGDRIAASGARVVFVGLGCPRQELFVHAMREHVAAPLVAVGAAFDYHAGQLRKPPAWMQAAGLEWLWRLSLEPRRLWRRYLLLNPAYAARLLAQWSRLWKARPAQPIFEPVQGFPV